ncbi:hypothetical protein GCK72_020470 [Caenorhabditis remanei]|uniref:F-box domain-containing protein n=1 Tax=Caenorhabditis remanei TaxID=31234 RepID=A0A6A5GGV5_CAERE|nr:hypothetical protein GCK72_020470 [Caenorhabditis remanei]KAF1753913.1 hypothetical protein GCK72_020470 [Caenorhabditis remanei]
MNHGIVLSEMPDIVLQTVMNNLDFRSIMILRKVCRRFQCFIDETAPPSSISEMTLAMNSRRFRIEFYDPCAIAEQNMIKIKYKHSKKVRYLELKVSEASEIQSILPLISPNFLEIITITKGKGETNKVLELDEVAELQQWKVATGIEISHHVTLPMKHFAHFSKVEISLETVSQKNLRSVMKILLGTRAPERFLLNHKINDVDKIKEVFGNPYAGNIEDHENDKCWFFGIPRNNDEVLMSLRKVCRDLRNFIDDTVPATSLEDYCITVNSEKLVLEMTDSDSKYIKTEYTVNPLSAESTEKMNQNSAENFWNDIEIILRHQTKVVLTSLVIFLELPETSISKLERTILEKNHSSFLAKFQNLLKSQHQLLRVKHIHFLVRYQEEIMSVLPYIHSKFLEKITIYPKRGESTRELVLREVVKLEQWKAAKELDTISFFMMEPLENYLHFSSAKIHIENLTPEIIQQVKEKFLENPAMQNFELHHEPCYKNREFKEIFEKIFDGEYDDQTYEHRWFCRIPGNNEDVISIRTTYFSWIIFTRIKLSKIYETNQD